MVHLLWIKWLSLLHMAIIDRDTYQNGTLATWPLLMPTCVQGKGQGCNHLLVVM
jgi:hypothetical protein